ncbi:MAG: SAM-dependent methyltransferase, MidA family/SAM-dependent methyltransferase, MidA family [Chloroflexi bacterium]|nr:MAG: SAM-dependent methyltransferase, MidA family/SAM-dependent methyltransferase, MidA family [Chloroflexota bacterium]
MNLNSEHSSHVIGEIRSRIKRTGKIPFSEFMEVALYLPKYGYYCVNEKQPYQEDYFTSPSVSPVFGACIAIQLMQMWLLLCKPKEFAVVEIGCGNGNLFRDITNFASKVNAEFAACLKYFPTDIDDQVPSQIIGCVISNELLDAFPVARFRVIEGSINEVFVTLDENENIIEVTEKCSNPQINEYLASLENPLQEGHKGEFNVGIDDWMRKVTDILSKGFVITIDYGGYKEDVYSKSNSKGTLQTYYKHVYGLSPYQKVGQQDLTAKLDFSRVIDAGYANGMCNIGLIEQAEFLKNNGIKEMENQIRNLNLGNREKQENLYAIDMLCRADRLGGFKVLIQSKNQDVRILEKLWTSRDALDGLAKNPPLKKHDHIGILPNQYSSSYVEIDNLFEDFTETF